MNIEEVKKLGDGSPFDCLIVLIKDYSVATTKTGNKYISGTCLSEDQFGFKIWDGVLTKMFSEVSHRSKLFKVAGKTDYYGGNFSIVISEVVEQEGNPLEFMEKVYDKDLLWTKLNKILSDNMSNQGYQLFNEIISPYKEDFMLEVAAISFHDNFLSGLLAHTYKMCAILHISLKLYNEMMKSCDKDLLFLACAIHDIGKIKEYKYGARSEISYAVHTTLGVEIISGFKSKIVESYGEKWYYRLLSVVTQHHGEFGDNPRTVEAYIIHLVDYFESQMQLINQNLPLDGVKSIGKFKVE